MATPTVSKAQDIAKEKTKEKKDQICESVSTEREEFMRLVNKEDEAHSHFNAGRDQYISTSGDRARQLDSESTQSRDSGSDFINYSFVMKVYEHNIEHVDIRFTAVRQLSLVGCCFNDLNDYVCSTGFWDFIYAEYVMATGHLHRSIVWQVSYLAADSLFPEWKIWTQFLHQTTDGLRLDGLAESHPIEVDINHASKIDEIFDAISYRKGASIIRMLQSYLGAEPFQIENDDDVLWEADVRETDESVAGR